MLGCKNVHKSYPSLCARPFAIWFCSYCHEEVRSVLLSLESGLDHKDKGIVEILTQTDTWKVVVHWGFLPWCFWELCSHCHGIKPELACWVTIYCLHSYGSQQTVICEWGRWQPPDQESRSRPPGTNRRTLQLSPVKRPTLRMQELVNKWLLF